MHLEVYRGRPDVNAVVHAHPPVSTAFAVCRRGLETVEHTAKIVLNAQLLGGGVPLTEEEVARLQGLRGMYQTLREVRHG